MKSQKSTGSIPCYADTAITIQRIIQDELKDFQGLSSVNLNIILESCNNDRIKVYNEINKIITFFEDKKITTENLSKLVNSPRIDDFNYLRDEAIKGNKAEMNRLLNSTIIDQDRGVYYLSLINLRFYKLIDILNIKKRDNNLESVINALSHLFFGKTNKISLIN